ncbi:CocE/NonD family hydrolase [Nocardia sp. NPDC050793]|uniref:CocE/NonD family hydrolase n=1 Tax=Nocardia sp. NPDC050793 TaxID=3155159 RepID=UPI0033EFA86A
MIAHTVSTLRIPMRDGVELSATAFIPIGRDASTLLARSPYGSVDYPIMGGTGGIAPTLLTFVKAGYAVVWVECRGTFDSDGIFSPLADEVADGYDTVDWIVRQPWSDGKVGTYGMSYLGMTQWALATAAHPAHKAMAPAVTAMNWYKGVMYHPGGALSAGIAVGWSAIMRLAEEMRREDKNAELIAELTGHMLNGSAASEISPLTEFTALTASPWFSDLLAHPSYDSFWQQHDLTTDVGKVATPALLIAGWFDIFINQQLRDFELLRRDGATDDVREGSRLIVGPWDHYDGMLIARTPDRDFGVMASSVGIDLTAEHLAHFQRWMSDIPTEDTPPRVRLFVMGIDQWRDESDWPLPDTQYTDYYLDSHTLTTTLPDAAGEHTYVYNPADPVRTTESTRLSAIWEAADQRFNDDRQDVVRFSTPPLEQPVEVTGYVTAVLFVSSDAPDTDFTAKLIDVSPDGRAIALCNGIVRARYRNDLSTPKLLETGHIYELAIDMAVTSNVFLAGHRIRVDISSSDFPQYDRNTNTGGQINAEPIEYAVPATNTIHTGPDHPSRLVLPVIQR